MIRITIDFDPETNAIHQLSGPLENEELCAAILAAAGVKIRKHNERKAKLVTQVSPDAVAAISRN